MRVQVVFAPQSAEKTQTVLMTSIVTLMVSVSWDVGHLKGAQPQPVVSVRIISVLIPLAVQTRTVLMESVSMENVFLALLMMTATLTVDVQHVLQMSVLHHRVALMMTVLMEFVWMENAFPA